MKCQQFCEPQSGKFVCQITRGVTLTCNLHLCHLREYYKGIAEEKNFQKDVHKHYGYGVPYT